MATSLKPDPTNPIPIKSRRGGKKPDDVQNRMDKKLKQAEMLLSVSRKVAAIETLDEILKTLVEMTTWELGAERGTLFLNDPATGELDTAENLFISVDL